MYPILKKMPNFDQTLNCRLGHKWYVESTPPSGLAKPCIPKQVVAFFYARFAIPSVLRSHNSRLMPAKGGAPLKPLRGRTASAFGILRRSETKQ